MRLSFYWRSGYNIYVVESRRLQQIWTNCEHARKWAKNAWFQNFQINTCKNEPAKPVFMRALRGDRRNEKSPFRALTHNLTIFQLTEENCVEMKKARSGRWHRLFTGQFVESSLSRNEKSPFRALTPFYFLRKTNYGWVEMKKARSGRWHWWYKSHMWLPSAP